MPSLLSGGGGVQGKKYIGNEVIALRPVFDAEEKASVTANKRNLVKKLKIGLRNVYTRMKKYAENIAKEEAARAGISD